MGGAFHFTGLAIADPDAFEEALRQARIQSAQQQHTARINEDNDWTSREFWKDYRNDPERIARKQADKRRREEEQEARKKQARIVAWQKGQAATTRGTQRPVSNDWLLHAGNVSFCHDRTQFVAYRPIKAHAHLGQADSRPALNVIGVGSVRLPIKKQLGQDYFENMEIANVLHIPAATCNAISASRLPRMGKRLKNRDDGRFVVYDVDSNKSFLCGDLTSGRHRVCMAGEDDNEEEARHATCGRPISIWADREELRRVSGGWYIA